MPLSSTFFYPGRLIRGSLNQPNRYRANMGARPFRLARMRVPSVSGQLPCGNLYNHALRENLELQYPSPIENSDSWQEKNRGESMSPCKGRSAPDAGRTDFSPAGSEARLRSRRCRTRRSRACGRFRLPRRIPFQSGESGLRHGEAVRTYGPDITRPLDLRRCGVPARDGISRPDSGSRPPRKAWGMAIIDSFAPWISKADSYDPGGYENKRERSGGCQLAVQASVRACAHAHPRVKALTRGGQTIPSRDASATVDRTDRCQSQTSLPFRSCTRPASPFAN